MIKREIAFTALSYKENSEDEFFNRHNSYKNAKELRKDILLINPLKIHIGGIYDSDVRLNKGFAEDEKPKTVEREYTIDIDIDVYDYIRTCCVENALCQRCFTFLKAAYEALNFIFKRSFGFKHILWIFSGRRGIHAWICDKEARTLNYKNRVFITNFLDFTYSSEKMDYLVKRELIDREEIYPLLLEVYNILKKYHGFLLEDMRILDKKNIHEVMMSMIKRYTGSNFDEEELENYKKLISGVDKFSFIVKFIRKKTCCRKKTKLFSIEFVVGFLYPKLDYQVSTSINHLLKAPFSVHNKTMKISLPIINFDTFDVSSVTLRELLKESLNKKRNLIWKEIKFFNNFIKNCKN